MKNEHTWAQIGNDRIWEHENVELLGIALDSELKFNEHIESICAKQIKNYQYQAECLNFSVKKKEYFSCFFRKSI